MLKNSYNIIDESLTNFSESEKISNTSNISFLKQWTCDLSCVHWVLLETEAYKITKADPMMESIKNSSRNNFTKSPVQIL